MDVPTLRTPRLLLRPWTPQDAPTLLEILQEPDIFKYFPPSPPPTLEGVQRYVSHHLAHWQERGYGHWAVADQPGGRPAGWCGLEYLPETGETEVAYLLSRSVWGRGYATEAARAALRFGFQEAGLEGIIGLVHQGNLASIRVLEKCGLRFVDRKVYFGMELCRYRIERAEFQGESASV
jgi:ribosomal-protein-alanine N-acetyltransferase